MNRAANCGCRQFDRTYTAGRRHGSTRVKTRLAMCDCSDDGLFCTVSKISASAAASCVFRISQLSSPCQGRRHGLSRQALCTVYYSTNDTCRATLLQLSWAWRRAGSTLYRAFGLYWQNCGCPPALPWGKPHPDRSGRQTVLYCRNVCSMNIGESYYLNRSKC